MNAFPIAIPAGCEGWEDGMTLRDYFAGQALVALINKNNNPVPQEFIAGRAYAYADAMLEARGE
jgi:hypothetical protein